MTHNTLPSLVAALSALLATAGFVRSQDVTATAVLQADLNVESSRVGPIGAATQTNTLPTGTALTGGASVSSGNATQTFDPIATSRRSIGFVATASARAPQAQSSLAYGAAARSADVLLTLTSRSSVSGQLVVEEVRQDGTGSRIDIGDDGVYEWITSVFYNPPIGYPNPRVESFAVSVGPNAPLEVRIHTPAAVVPWNTTLTGARSVTNRMSLTFVPDNPCQTSSYGTTCDPYLMVSVARRLADGVDIKLDGANPGLPAVALLGTAISQLVLPIPPACTLWTTVDTSAPFVWIGGERLVPLSLGLPGTLSFNVQAAVVDFRTGSVVLSAPLAVNCN